MTIEEFNNLDEGNKRIIIFEAGKISEIKDEFTKYQLFMVDDFFIETRTSINNIRKRIVVTYNIDNLPVKYADDVQQRIMEKY